MEFFYNILIENKNNSQDLFDKVNPYNDYFEIKVGYDLNFFNEKLEDYNANTWLLENESEVFSNIEHTSNQYS